MAKDTMNSSALESIAVYFQARVGCFKLQHGLLGWKRTKSARRGMKGYVSRLAAAGETSTICYDSSLIDLVSYDDTEIRDERLEKIKVKKPLIDEMDSRFNWGCQRLFRLNLIENNSECSAPIEEREVSGESKNIIICLFFLFRKYRAERVALAASSLFRNIIPRILTFLYRLEYNEKCFGRISLDVGWWTRWLR